MTLITTTAESFKRRGSSVCLTLLCIKSLTIYSSAWEPDAQGCFSSDVKVAPDVHKIHGECVNKTTRLAAASARACTIMQQV